MSISAMAEKTADVTSVSTGRLLSTGARDLDGHLRQTGPLPWAGGPGPLAELIEASGLTGRGGAGFPSARKLSAVAAGKRAVVVANGAEGEPLSSKDRVLLTRAPHLVLDGLQLVAEATNAAEAYAYVPADLADGISACIAERHGIDRVAVQVCIAPDRFISGEESAVVARLSGGLALPRDKSRMVVTAGVRGRPTLVHNVETLAHLALAARRGPAWFREAGTPEEPGTFLTTISGGVAQPGVYEFAHGVPLGELLEAAGGRSAPLQAVLIGGYHGAWVPWPAAAGAPVSRAGLAAFGASPGAGVIAALPASTCGLTQTARILSYLAEQSAGQCGPCLNGLPMLAEAFERLVGMPGWPGAPGALAEVQRLTGLVEGRGACHHPDGTVRLARSALQTFAEDVAAHRAGACTARSSR
ncbi:MAG: NADH:ubiquinone oxidoreductase, NADH-binding (51 kD) subunit [Mycobacterium sp.]|nr:NADH:ubiquinone oxidoreductase, NADH-binding (51 kD) subunit [Mycobacterium sp.]